MEHRGLTGINLIKLTLRSYLIRLFYNYKFLFGQGLCYCLLPYACSCEKTKSINIAEFIKRHEGFFNSNEYLIGYALGAIIKLEEEHDYKKIETLKKIMAANLGAIGDNLIYKIILPVMMLISANILVITKFQFSNIYLYSVIFMLLCFNVFNFYIRYRGIIKGYQLGIRSLAFAKSKSYAMFQKVCVSFKKFLSGFLIVNIITTYISDFENFHLINTLIFMISASFFVWFKYKQVIK